MGLPATPVRRPLERPEADRLLCAVRPGHVPQGTLRQGILTGALAAAATAGALLGFGMQQGMPARPFNAVASLLLGDRARGIWGFHPVVTVAGVIVQVALAVVWALLFARLAGGMRGKQLAAMALLIALAALAADVFLASRVATRGVFDMLAPAQVVALHLVLGLTLAVGMRLATSYFWSD
jgi:hypothetical protein